MKRILLVLVVVIGIGGLSVFLLNKPPKTTTETGVRYVALGDSYTIGEGAKKNEAWPELLGRDITTAGKKTVVVANPSVTGWTTKDVIDNELSIYDKSQPDFATLQIGANDWVQGVPAEEFKRNLVIILDHMQSKLADKSKLVLVTIPDFSVSPTGPRYGNGRDIPKGLTEFNLIIKAEANKRNLPVADVFAISQRVDSGTDWFAKDGLHPGAKQYAAWEQEAILPAVKKLFNLL